MSVVLNAPKDRRDAQSARRGLLWIKKHTNVSNNKWKNAQTVNTYSITNATHAHQTVKFAIHNITAQNVNQGTIY